jgi:cell pole-organizing protein PopZ
MSDSRSQQQEPSMEDILSSIRRIISEDGDEKPEAEAEGDDVPEAEAIPEAEAVPEEPAAEGEDVFDLTEMVDESGNVLELGEGEEDEGVPGALKGDEDDDIFEEPAAEPKPAVEMDDDEPLISEGAGDQAAESLAKLNQATSPSPVDPSLLRIMNSGFTIEQYVLEMLRPILREWLDQNLPTMVERLVDREIEKLSRRADPLE